MIRSLLILMLGCSIAAAAQSAEISITPAGDAFRGLSPAEIELARQLICERAGGDLLRFVSIERAENGKSNSEVRAKVVLLSRQGPIESLVDLSSKRIESWKATGGQPLVTAEEYKRVAELVAADPSWDSILRGRGINPEEVHIEPWTAGEPVEGFETHRMFRALAFWKGNQRQRYGIPIEGVIALVDLTSEIVLNVTDSGYRGLRPFSTELYAATDTPSDWPRPRVEPFGRVTWGRWSFVTDFTEREGLFLRDVRLFDGTDTRLVLSRASLSEIFVPYGDPDENWRWRAGFDAGEYGLGKLGASLKPGLNAPLDAVYLDGMLVSDSGEPSPLLNAVAIHEDDDGLLWAHYDSEHGWAAARDRRLILSSVATIGNYDYLLNWIFREDGSLEFEASLTGILLTKGVRNTTCPVCEGKPELRHGSLVAAGVTAPFHQHHLTLRLDFDIDGPVNSLQEIDAEPLPDPAGNAITVAKSWVLEEGPRVMNHERERHWRIVNQQSQTSIRHYRGFTLLPSDDASIFLTDPHHAHRNGAYARYPLWVTRYDRDELHVSGDYPNGGTESITEWADHESVLSQDIVLWYTLGLTHVPRPEDYPIMPRVQTRLKIVPSGFFERTPNLPE